MAKEIFFADINGIGTSEDEMTELFAVATSLKDIEKHLPSSFYLKGVFCLQSETDDFTTGFLVLIFPVKNRPVEFHCAN